MPQHLTLKIDLSAPVTLRTAASSVMAFFRWWGGQLRDAAPTLLRQTFFCFEPGTTLDVRDALWRIDFAGGGRFAATLDPNLSDDDLALSASRILPEGLPTSLNVILPGDTALIRRINTPSTAARHFRSVAHLQLDRLSPFRSDDVLFDCRQVVSDEEDDQNCVIEVAILPKATLHALERRLRKLDWAVRHFEIGDTGFVISPTGMQWTRQRQRLAFLAVFAALAWIAAVWLGPLFRDEKIASLKANIAALENSVDRSTQVRQALQRYDLPDAALSNDRANSADILLALTKAFPDDTHLSFLSLKRGQIAMRGETASNAPLRQILEQTGLFTKTSLFIEQKGGDFRVEGVLRATKPRRPAG